MKVLKMVELNERPPKTHDLIKEYKNSYVIEYYRTYDLTANTQMHISLVLDVTVDEYYWLNSDTRENIEKFNDRLSIELGQYIRRYLL